MASETFKAHYSAVMQEIERAEQRFHPPGVRACIIFADNVEVCVIGTHWSHLSAVVDKIYLITAKSIERPTIAEARFSSINQMQPVKLSPDGARITISLAGTNEDHNIADLITKPRIIER
jgi:hypothetical protein